MHQSLIVGAGMSLEAPRMPVVSTADLVADYLDNVSRRLARLTVRSYTINLKLWSESVGHKPVASLGKSDVLAHLDRFPHWGRSTRSLAYRILRAWWSWALEESDIAPLPRLRVPGIERRAPVSWDDLERWRLHIRPWLADWVTVGLESGMRPGEQTNIRWQDVDVTNRSAIVIGKTGRRLVILSRLACETLGRVAAVQPDGPIFRNSCGTPWKPTQLGQAFAHASKRAGVAIVPYSLRHLFAVRHIERGTDSLTLARLMGHSNTAMLAKHYGQWSVSTLRAAIDRVA